MLLSKLNFYCLISFLFVFNFSYAQLSSENYKTISDRYYSGDNYNIQKSDIANSSWRLTKIGIFRFDHVPSSPRPSDEETEIYFDFSNRKVKLIYESEKFSKGKFKLQTEEFGQITISAFFHGNNKEPVEVFPNCYREGTSILLCREVLINGEDLFLEYSKMFE